MAIVGYEWVIVGVIVLAVFIWGPGKIPELARSLGRARKEFEDASKSLTSASSASVPGPRIESVGSDPLVDTARKLGIDTEGKTRQEISDEIVRSAQSKKLA